MTDKEYEAEIARLHQFVLQLAGHLADAAEVLGKLAAYKITKPDRQLIGVEKVAGYKSETKGW